MKIHADENVSHRLVEALNLAGVKHSEIELSSVYSVGHKGWSDVDWVSEFAADGGRAILSGDKDFQRKMPQIRAITNTGLIVILLPERWNTANLNIKAASILIWWDEIERKLKSAPQGTIWKLKWIKIPSTYIENIRTRHDK